MDKVRITVHSDISSTIIYNCMFNVSIFEMEKKTGIHDTLHSTLSWILAFYLNFNDIGIWKLLWTKCRNDCRNSNFTPLLWSRKLSYLGPVVEVFKKSVGDVSDTQPADEPLVHGSFKSSPGVHDFREADVITDVGGRDDHTFHATAVYIFQNWKTKEQQCNESKQEICIFWISKQQ